MWQKARMAWQKLLEGFSSLKGSPRDLYIIFVLKVIEAFGYFSLSLMYTTFLTQAFNVNDYQAGLSYGIWGALITAYNVLLAPVIDKLGVQKSLMLSFTLSSIGRLAMALTHSKVVLFCLLYGPIPMGTALGVPVMVIGVKRYTSVACRGFAFGLFYSLMNIAALLNGVVYDFFRVKLKYGFKMDQFGPNAAVNDGLKLLVILGSVTSVVGLVLASVLTEKGKERPKVDATNASDVENEDGNEENDTRPFHPGNSNARLSDPRNRRSSNEGSHPPSGSPRSPQSAPQKSVFQEMKELFKSEIIRKFLIVCLLTVNLKQIFRHLDATLPKYQTRAFGCDAHVGVVYSINPFLIVLLVPFVGALTTKFNHYDMIHYGSYLTALSPFWLAAFQTEWAAVMFVVFLSLGEMIWSPRWYDYSMWAAPHGKEGIFTAMSAAPLFAAKLPTGIISGKLLEIFCPDNYECRKEGTQEAPDGFVPRPCNGRTMWLIIGIITVMSPLGLLILQKWLRPSDLEIEKGNEDGLEMQKMLAKGSDSQEVVDSSKQHDREEL